MDISEIREKMREMYGGENKPITDEICQVAS